MATVNKNLSTYDKDAIPNADHMRFGIVVSEWNEEITNGLLDGALETLKLHGAKDDHISVEPVPGAFELPSAAQLMLEMRDVDAVITIGAVIRGETAHFDYVCQACAAGVKDVALQYRKPVIFCVLTDDNIDQSRARSGGKHGNKGTEAAITAIKMVDLSHRLKNRPGKGSLGF